MYSISVGETTSSSSPRIAVDSSGGIWITYTDDANDIVYVAYSSDNGASFTTTIIDDGLVSASLSRIFIDSNDDVHIGYSGTTSSDYVTKYKKYSNGSWSSAETVYSNSSIYWKIIQIYEDDDGYISCLLWDGDDGGRKERYTTSWGNDGTPDFGQSGAEPSWDVATTSSDEYTFTSTQAISDYTVILIENMIFESSYSQSVTGSDDIYKPLFYFDGSIFHIIVKSRTSSTYYLDYITLDTSYNFSKTNIYSSLGSISYYDIIEINSNPVIYFSEYDYSGTGVQLVKMEYDGSSWGSDSLVDDSIRYDKFDMVYHNGQLCMTVFDYGADNIYYVSDVEPISHIPRPVWFG